MAALIPSIYQTFSYDSEYLAGLILKGTITIRADLQQGMEIGVLV